MTEFSKEELARKAGQFGGRLKEHIGGDVVVTVAIAPPEDPTAHLLDGTTIASWPVYLGHTANVGIPTLAVWMDPAGTADQVAAGIEKSMRAQAAAAAQRA